MGKVWMMFESYWRKLPQNEIDGLPKKGVSANAFEAGWKAAQQSVQLTAFGVGMLAFLAGFGVCWLAFVR